MYWLILSDQSLGLGQGCSVDLHLSGAATSPLEGRWLRLRHEDETVRTSDQICILQRLFLALGCNPLRPSLDAIAQGCIGELSPD